MSAKTTLGSALRRSLLAAVVLAAGTLVGCTLPHDDADAGVTEQPDGGGPPAEAPLEVSRSAPWKAPLEGRENLPAGLDDYRDRIGSWLSEEWLGEGADRHRIRFEYESALDGRLLTARSYRVYPDGREEYYLEENLFPSARRPAVLPAFLFFDSGLYADATWIADGEGLHRLDCDLYWPDGRTGRVRDIYVRVAPDTIRWFSFFQRDGEMPGEPDSELTMVRRP